MAPVHFAILLLALGALLLCFMPAFKQAQAGRAVWPRALGPLLTGPYMLPAWLLAVLPRRRRATGEPR